MHKHSSLTSFWNDSKAVVVATANEKFESAQVEVLKVIIKPATSKIKEEFREYYFANDKLNKIVDTKQTGASKGAAVRCIDSQNSRIEGYSLLYTKSINIFCVLKYCSYLCEQYYYNDKKLHLKRRTNGTFC